jgi:hypothetical protein
MRALCWHGKGDVRVDTVPEPNALLRNDPFYRSFTQRCNISQDYPDFVHALPECHP